MRPFRIIWKFAPLVLQFCFQLPSASVPPGLCTRPRQSVSFPTTLARPLWPTLGCERRMRQLCHKHLDLPSRSRWKGVASCKSRASSGSRRRRSEGKASCHSEVHCDVVIVGAGMQPYSRPCLPRSSTAARNRGTLATTWSIQRKPSAASSSAPHKGPFGRCHRALLRQGSA